MAAFLSRPQCVNIPSTTRLLSASFNGKIWPINGHVQLFIARMNWKENTFWCTVQTDGLPPLILYDNIDIYQICPHVTVILISSNCRFKSELPNTLSGCHFRTYKRLKSSNPWLIHYRVYANSCNFSHVRSNWPTLIDRPVIWVIIDVPVLRHIIS